MKKPLATLGALGLGAALWGHFEAGWVRLRSIPVPIPGLPEELDGLRVVHLSDFHLGFPSRGEAAVERAIEWTAARDPDLVVITGDLLSRPAAEGRLRELLERVPGSFAVLGNHDFALSRDPFSKPSAVSDLPSTTVLFDEARTVELRGRSVQIVGVDPRSYRLGQIVVPYGRGKVRFAHLRWTYAEGLYRRPGGVLHVSPGLGTTFVPFRFFARPEATELVLGSVP